MNKLLIALLFVSPAANAEVLFQLTNKAGGQIVLTDELCKNKKNKLAYSTSNGMTTLLGCWTADDSFIHINWYDSDLRSYSYDGWVDVRSNKNLM